jgi:DNA-binding response OmpR family regulator
LLIAEDADEAAVLALVIQRAGLAVTQARDLPRALQSWAERPADLICVALSAPDPRAQVKQVRAETEGLLVLVVEAVGEQAHYDLLEAGADLVVERPYSARLLIARVRALLRRAGGTSLFSMPNLELGGVILDPASRTVETPERSVQRLTHLEFRLLYTLMLHQGQVLPTEAIVERVWGYAGQGDRDLVRGLIRRLRAKVEPDPRHPRYIVTVSGLGYSFQSSPDCR